MFRLSKYYIDTDSVKDIFKKIGINFVTAGVIGLFITHFDSWSRTTVFGAGWVLALGSLSMLLSICRRNKS
jgi:hypothetical protein